MENIRRSIKLFFTIYGGLLFQIIGGIAIFFFVLKGVNYIYKEDSKTNSQENLISEQEIIDKQKELEKEEKDILFISNFLDYCNDKQIEEAYSMLSEECIKQKYQTIDIFKKEYIDKIFAYKKEYEIKKEDNRYKITILEGILESGNIENRKSIISYYKIEEDILERYIFIER